MCWICSDCGEKYGEHRGMMSTWHYDYCEYCGNYKAVTEDRDYDLSKKPNQEND